MRVGIDVAEAPARRRAGEGAVSTCWPHPASVERKYAFTGLGTPCPTLARVPSGSGAGVPVPQSTADNRIRGPARRRGAACTGVRRGGSGVRRQRDASSSVQGEASSEMARGPRRSGAWVRPQSKADRRLRGTEERGRGAAVPGSRRGSSGRRRFTALCVPSAAGSNTADGPPPSAAGMPALQSTADRRIRAPPGRSGAVRPGYWSPGPAEAPGRRRTGGGGGAGSGGAGSGSGGGGGGRTPCRARSRTRTTRHETGSKKSARPIWDWRASSQSWKS